MFESSYSSIVHPTVSCEVFPKLWCKPIVSTSFFFLSRSIDIISISVFTDGEASTFVNSCTFGVGGFWPSAGHQGTGIRASRLSRVFLHTRNS